MRLRALLIACLSLAAFAATPAFPDRDGKDDKGKGGQKDDKGGKKDKDPDPKDTPEGKYCLAVAREFAAKDADALVARLAKDEKLKLKFGDKVDGTFMADQAKSVLKEWFKEKGDITLTLKSVKDNVGVFEMLVKSGKNHKSPLHVEIAKRGDSFKLVRIEKLPETHDRELRRPAALLRMILPRAAAAAVLSVLAILLFVGERRAAAERADAAAEAAAAVQDARAELDARVRAREKSCSDLAERALDATGTLRDPAEMFAALEAVQAGAPQHSGFQLEDRDGKLLAWSGDTLDDAALRAMPRESDGTIYVDTPAVRRLAVRRRRTSPLDGVPVLAVCHRPVEIRYPLRNRFFESWSLADDVAARHRVASAAVLPPGSPNAAPVPSAFGGEIARVDVQPLDGDEWIERAASDQARTRAQILAAMLVAAGLWAWWETTRWMHGRPSARWLVRGALLVTARLALGAVSLAGILPESPLVSVARYSHALPLALAATPLDLLLTAAAVLGAVACVRTAARARPLAPHGALPAILGVLGAAAFGHVCLAWLVDDVVRNSTVAFFPDDAVLPRAASAALLASLFAVGAAAVLIVDAAWRWLRPAVPWAATATAALAVAASVAMAPAWFPGEDHPAAAALTLTSVLGFAVVLVPTLLDAGVSLRAAVAPLGIAIALFAPLERRIDIALRDTVASYAVARISGSAATESEVVAKTLRELADSPELRAALASGRIPRELLLRLWSRSTLAQRPGGSAVEVLPLRTGGALARFSVNLPPTTMLPQPAPDLDGVSEPLQGVGAGRDGRWIVGAQILRDGGAVVARIVVTLEARSPSFVAVPELRVLGPSLSADDLAMPPLWITQYDVAGSVLPLETNDPYRPAGSPLDMGLRDEALGGESAPWRDQHVADRDLAVVVLPERGAEGAVTGFQAFSFETGGARRLALRGARAALCGALVSVLLLVATARRWARGARLRLTQRLVASFVIVSGLPLLVLGWANRNFALQRAQEATESELRQAVSLVESVLQMPQDYTMPLLLDPEVSEQTRDARLLQTAYQVGHHFNVFFEARLRASSDPGLFDTELLPRRLPGPVYREVNLLRRPFYPARATLGDSTFDIGYAPLRDPAGDVIGAVSVPLLQQRKLRDRELADGVTAILALYLTSLAAAVAVGTWIARRLTAPLRDLTAATQRVAKGDLSQPVPPGGPDELGEVVGGFNRMMRDLAESRERLVRAEKEAAWRDMARQVAHEVKNPLTPMRLAAEHIRRAWRDKSAQFSEILERGVDVIVRQTESLKQIATAFSDFARLSGRRREPVDLGETARGVLDLWRSTEELTLNVEIAEGLPPVLADPDEMRRVLVNIAKNAVEAVEGRAGVVTVRLRRDTSSSTAEFLMLTIADDGPGIPEEAMHRLFEPYFSTKTSGTGLGLAICKRAIEDLGGTIAIESVTGKGTTVTVRLPVAPPAPIGETERSAAASGPPGGS